MERKGLSLLCLGRSGRLSVGPIPFWTKSCRAGIWEWAIKARFVKTRAKPLKPLPFGKLFVAVKGVFSFSNGGDWM